MKKNLTVKDLKEIVKQCVSEIKQQLKQGKQPIKQVFEQERAKGTLATEQAVQKQGGSQQAASSAARKEQGGTGPGLEKSGTLQKSPAGGAPTEPGQPVDQTRRPEDGRKKQEVGTPPQKPKGLSESKVVTQAKKARFEDAKRKLAQSFGIVEQQAQPIKQDVEIQIPIKKGQGQQVVEPVEPPVTQGAQPIKQDVDIQVPVDKPQGRLQAPAEQQVTAQAQVTTDQRGQQVIKVNVQGPVEPDEVAAEEATAGPPMQGDQQIQVDAIQGEGDMELGDDEVMLDIPDEGQQDLPEQMPSQEQKEMQETYGRMTQLAGLDQNAEMPQK